MRILARPKHAAQAAKGNEARGAKGECGSVQASPVRIVFRRGFGDRGLVREPGIPRDRIDSFSKILN